MAIVWSQLPQTGRQMPATDGTLTAGPLIPLTVEASSHSIAKAIACGIMLLVLPSCGIPPLRHPEPGPGLPADFNGETTPDNSSQLGIEEYLESKALHVGGLD